MAWITSDDVKNLLKGVLLVDIADINQQLENVLIPVAQSECEQYIGHKITTMTETRFYHGTGRETLVLDRRPIQRANSVEIYAIPYTSKWLRFQHINMINTVDQFGDRIAPDNPNPDQNTDMIVDCAVGILQIPLTALTYALIGIPLNFPQFIPGTNNVKVNFTYGYDEAALPLRIKNACAYMAAIYVIMERGAIDGQGVRDIRIGEMSKAYFQGASWKTSMPYSGMVQKYHENVQMLLAPYKILGLR
jgi:hypothetical protein